MTRLFTIIEERPSSRYDGEDYEMDNILSEVDRIIEEISKMNRKSRLKRVKLPKIEKNIRSRS